MTRAVFVIDKKGIVRYVQIVPEITAEPDYEALLKAIEVITFEGIEDAGAKARCFFCGSC